MATSTCLEVFAGCYERTTLGFQVYENVKEGTFSISAKFTDNSHIGCVKTIAASDAFLATGSTDETIHLYNLQTNRELGTLLQHDGSITSLCFHGDGHMISGSGDGTLCIWNTASWELMKSLRAHKGGVNSIAVHPSGKLALTSGQDRSLRTWNLIKGRVAYTTNIKQAADFVMWSPDGDLYIVVINGIINVYTINTATIISTIDCKRRVLAISFLTNCVLAVGGEGENIQLYQLSEGTSVCKCDFKAHDNRIKSLRCTYDRRREPSETCRWLVSASSDSLLKIWAVDIQTLEKPFLLASINTTARLTCVAIRPVAVSLSEVQTRTQTATKADQAKDAKTSVKRRATGSDQDLKKKKAKTKQQKP